MRLGSKRETPGYNDDASLQVRRDNYYREFLDKLSQIVVVPPRVVLGLMILGRSRSAFIPIDSGPKFI